MASSINLSRRPRTMKVCLHVSCRNYSVAVLPGRLFSTTSGSTVVRSSSIGPPIVQVRSSPPVSSAYSPSKVPPRAACSAGMPRQRAYSLWTKPIRSLHLNRRLRAEDTGDWYGRWERHKRRQYEVLRRHVEDNPYDALFGASNRWLGWLKDSTASSSQRARCHSQSNFPHKQDETTGAWSSVSENPSSSPDKTTVTVKSEVDYEIDPITLRKVPKRNTSAEQAAERPSELFSIPVRKFRPAQPDENPKTSEEKLASEITARVKSRTEWLSREGFTPRTSVLNTEKNASIVSKKEKPRSATIESALDRHLRENPREDASRSPQTASAPKWKSASAFDAHKTSSQEQQPPERASYKSTLNRSCNPPSPEEERSSIRSHKIEWQQASNSSTKAPSSPNTASHVNQLHDSARREVSGQSSQHGVARWRNPSAQTPRLTSSQVASLRSKLVPLKTQIDTLKDDYVSLQHQILLEKRRLQLQSEKKAARQAQLKLDKALKDEVQGQKAAMSAMEARDGTTKAHGASVAVPNAELRGEGDVASNVHEFFNRARWYKRKAPHAKCELDAKMQRLAREKAFVREIRGIYEDTYGTINASHRQTVKPANSGELSNNTTPISNSYTAGIGALELFVATELSRAPSTSKLRGIAASIDQSIRELRQHDSQNLSEKLSILKERVKPLLLEVQKSSIASSISNITKGSESPNSLYRILAYDHSTQRVTSAKTESSTPLANDGPDAKEPSLPMHLVLTKLYNPGKFLPHLHALQNRGFDVVSVTGDVVMLKKVREPVVSRDDLHGRPNPIDGTTTPEVSAGNFASPTGYVNYGPVIPPEEQQRPQSAAPRSDDKVKRQEDVFSGDSRRWHESRPMSKRVKRRARKWQALRKMLLTGTITSAICYGVGVIEERRLQS